MKNLHYRIINNYITYNNSSRIEFSSDDGILKFKYFGFSFIHSNEKFYAIMHREKKVT